LQVHDPKILGNTPTGLETLKSYTHELRSSLLF
jgi:hypothetical protein